MFLQGPRLVGMHKSLMEKRDLYLYFSDITPRQRECESHRKLQIHLSSKAKFLWYKFPNPGPPKFLGNSSKLHSAEAKHFFSDEPFQKNCLWICLISSMTIIWVGKIDMKYKGRLESDTFISVARPLIDSKLPFEDASFLRIRSIIGSHKREKHYLQ